MFFTLLQEPLNGEYLSERFICFEADSQEDAIEQAKWFELDLEEKIGTEEDYDGYPRWWWHYPSCGTREPEISGIPMLSSRNRYTNDGWVVVYKNGNLLSSSGTALEREIQRQSVEPL